MGSGRSRITGRVRDGPGRALSAVTLPGRLLQPWHAVIPEYGGHRVVAAAGAGLGEDGLDLIIGGVQRHRQRPGNGPGREAMTGSSSARDAGSVITAIWLPLVEARCEACRTSQRRAPRAVSRGTLLPCGISRGGCATAGRTTGSGRDRGRATAARSSRGGRNPGHASGTMRPAFTDGCARLLPARMRPARALPAARARSVVRVPRRPWGGSAARRWPALAARRAGRRSDGR